MKYNNVRVAEAFLPHLIVIWPCLSFADLQAVMSIISWSLSSLLKTWASVTEPNMDIIMELPTFL